MSHESAPRSIYDEEGNINEEVLRNEYGLNVDFAQTEVTFGEYHGTVGDMLDNNACPVGGKVREIFESTKATEGGPNLEGVVNYFNAMNQFMGADFGEFEITSETIASEDVKKNLQIFPSPQMS